MKKKRFVLLLILFVVIIANFFIVNDRYTTLDESEGGFAISDTASITKIFMVDKNNRSVKLEKEAMGKWIINDKHLALNFNMVMLLGTIKDIKVRYPVPLAARDNVITRLATIAKKVEVYTNSYRINLFNKVKLFPYEKLARTYYVGDATQDNMGTFMMMEGADQPYVVYIPSLRGFVYTRYSTNEDDWRDHTIFKTPIQNLASVRMEFLETPEESYVVETDERGNISMHGLNNNIPMAYDTLRMLQFVTAFKDIRFESVLNNKLDAEYIDSIASGPMAHIITLTERDGSEFVVKTYRKGGFSELYDSEGAALEPFDLDRLYAYINDDRDFVLIQYFVFDKIVRTASYLQNKQ